MQCTKSLLTVVVLFVTRFFAYPEIRPCKIIFLATNALRSKHALQTAKVSEI